jgi:hypothetical protein
MITKTITLAALISLPACTRGSHVEPIQITITNYSCQYSPSIFQADRRIAICPTMEECSKICEENRKKEGM